MKKKNKHDKIVLLARTNLNSIEVLIFKSLTDSCISYDGFVLVNSLSKEYDDMKKKKKLKSSTVNQRF